MSVKTLGCEEVLEELGAYSLGALDDGERQAVAKHLAVCPRCAAAHAEHAGAAEALLHAAPLAAPPPAVKAMLMAAVARDAAPGPWWRRVVAETLRSPRARIGMAFAAMAVLLSAVLVAVSAPSPQILAARLAADAGANALKLVARDAAPAASGVLRFRPDGTVGVLQAQGLPALPADRTYQLWLVRPDGSRDTGALFRAAGDILVVAPQAFSTYARFGVTIEPAGGSPAPTGPGALGL